MSTHSLGLAVADLGIPRAYPCSAYVTAGSICGATPTSMYHRTCGVDSHGKDIWLCPVHAALVASGAASCHDCAIRGGVRQARVYRIVMIPVRLPKL
jgi:hypothetical protein